MQFFAIFAFLFAVSITFVNGAAVKFYNKRSCGSASLELRNVQCGRCVDPVGDWYAAQVTHIAGNQRVTLHNQNKCTSKSQVGQWYGNVCGRAGKTAIRSVWIACPNKRSVNGTADATEEDDAPINTFDISEDLGVAED